MAKPARGLKAHIERHMVDLWPRHEELGRVLGYIVEVCRRQQELARALGYQYDATKGTYRSKKSGG